MSKRAAPLPRAFWFVWTGMLINRMGGFVVPFLALYLTRERGMAIEDAGVVVALWGAGSLVSGPVGGSLADTFGRRRTLALATVVGAAAMLFLGVARTPFAIAVGALMLGFFGDMHRPAVTATIADVVAPEDRPRAYGALYWAINLGFSIAPVVAGAAASGGFFWLFLGDAATTLVFGAIAWFFIPETRPDVAPSSRAGAGAHAFDEKKRIGFLAPYRDRVFLAFAATTFATACVFHQGFVALPVDMGTHGISPARFGQLIACNGVLIVIVQPIATKVAPRFVAARVLALGALLTGVGFGLTQLASTPPTYVATIVVWTLGEIVMAPVTPSVVAALAPASLRGTYQGALHMTWGASTLVAPAVGAMVLARFGAGALWTGCAVLGALAAAGCLALAPSLAREKDARAARGDGAKVAAATPAQSPGEQRIVAAGTSEAARSR